MHGVKTSNVDWTVNCLVKYFDYFIICNVFFEFEFKDIFTIECKAYLKQFSIMINLMVFNSLLLLCVSSSSSSIKPFLRIRNVVVQSVYLFY